MRANERELLASNIEFDPPLWQLTKQSRRIFLSPPSGYLYSFGYSKGRKPYLPDVAILENCPEVERRKVPLCKTTKDSLLAAILLRLEAPRV